MRRGGGGHAGLGVAGVLCLSVVLLATVPASSSQSAEPSEPAAPDSADLRPVFERYGLPARAQGKRNTCSVFVVTGAMEFALAEKQPGGSRLSVEFLNWASNQVVAEQEDGSFFSDLWTGLEKYGVCAEQDMPYAAKFDPQRSPSATALKHAKPIHKARLRLHWIKPWDPNKGLTEDQFLEVKKTLRRWPVCGGFLWPKKARWTDGVLQMAPREGVRDGHSVLLLGYQDDPKMPGGGVFWVRNSSKGPRHGAMTYEYVRTYMNDAVWIDYGGAPLSPPAIPVLQSTN